MMDMRWTTGMCKIAEAGDVMEDWWQLIAPESTKAHDMLTCRAMAFPAQVGLAQWNDACTSLGYHGDSTLTYQLLEEDCQWSHHTVERGY